MKLTIRVPGVEVEYCSTCGGIYYDQGELEKRLGQPISLDAWNPDNSPNPVHCPKCSQEMVSWKRGYLRIILCSHCKGIWVPKMLHAKKVLVSKNPKEIQVQNPLRSATWKRRSLERDNEIEVHQYLLSFLGFPYEYNEKANCYPIVTVCLIWINFIVFFLLPGQESTLNQFGFTPAHFSLATFYTVFTHMFLHGDIFHLLGNMYFLWITGDNIEDRIGSSRFLLFYFGCGILQTLICQLFDSSSSIPVIGASGAISSMIGAYLYLFPKAKILLVVLLFHPIKLPVTLLIPIWAIFQLIMAVYPSGVTSEIAYLAHFVGFLIGIIWIMVVVKRINWDIENPTVQK